MYGGVWQVSKERSCRMGGDLPITLPCMQFMSCTCSEFNLQGDHGGLCHVHAVVNLVSLLEVGNFSRLGL